MKKKFLVGLLALAMPLTACDFSFDSLKFWNKNEQNSQENQGKIDENSQNQNDDQHEEEHHEEEHHEEQGGGGEEHQEEQGGGGEQEHHDDEQIPSKTNLVIQESVSAILHRETFTQEQENYFVSRAIELDNLKVDIAKVESYVEGLSTLASESNIVLAVGSYLESIQKDGGLDDVAYFVSALGKSLLYTIKNDEGYETENLEALISALENEGNKLGENIYGLANTIVDTYSLATDVSFLNACRGIVDENYRVVTANLKSVLKSASGILSKFAEIKENVVYFVNLAKDVAKSVTDVAKKIETDSFSVAMFKVIDKVLTIDLGSAVGSAFDYISEFALSLKGLDDSYFAEINKYANPIEADIYAVLGFIEYLVKDVHIDVDSAMEAVAGFVDFATEIYGYLENEFKIPAFVGTIIKSVNTKVTLVKTVKLLANLLNTRLNSINAKTLTKIVSFLIFEPFPSSYRQEAKTYVWEDVPEAIRNQVDVIDMENDLSRNGSYFKDFYEPVTVDENGNAHTHYSYLMVNRYHYSVDENEYEDSYIFGDESESLANLDEIAGIAYKVIEEIASSEIPAQFARDLLDIVPSAYALFNEIKDNFAIDEETLNIIDTIVGLVSEKQELVEKTITDLFVVVKNLAGAFVKVEDKEADINLTAFVLNAIVNGLDLNSLKVSEERLEGLTALAEDVYEILDYVELADSISSFISYLADGVTIENAEQFAQAIYTIVVTMFVPVEK